MKRRKFIKTVATSAPLPFWLQGCGFCFGTPDFPIYARSDHETGHLVMRSQNWPSVVKDKIKIAIVGGGIAGLSAANSLKSKSWQLFELSNRLGGTSSAGALNGIRFSQGAHYDLDYPEHYGEEALKLLESLGTIKYQPWNKMWSFVDRQYIIPPERRQQCFANGKTRREIITPGPGRDKFLNLITRFTDKMPLPTRLIAPGLRYLNDLTFEDYLLEHMELTPGLKRQISYHMKDDYGAGISQVSALAGIHYFACRPYYREAINLFSPPQGNEYFIEKLSRRLPSEKILTKHLVKKIDEISEGFRLEVLDMRNKQAIIQKAEQVIYAGQKHALKYICPDQYDLFDIEQSPWMTVNLISRQKKGEYGFWQNEYLSENEAFLGFIDSGAQDQKNLKGKNVRTGYYCLKPEDRHYLATVTENKNRIIKETQGYIEEVLGKKIDPEAGFIHVMGHAMPIPKPGFLFFDANQHPKAKMKFAGVDNGRLPLLFEAVDSGIRAGRISS